MRALGIGLLSGGYGQEELERAGAYRVYEDPADLLNHVDEVAGRQWPLIGYWEFLAVAIGFVCVTTGWLHIHDPSPPCCKPRRKIQCDADRLRPLQSTRHS